MRSVWIAPLIELPVLRSRRVPAWTTLSISTVDIEMLRLKEAVIFPAIYSARKTPSADL